MINLTAPQPALILPDHDRNGRQINLFDRQNEGSSPDSGLRKQPLQLLHQIVG